MKIATGKGGEIAFGRPDLQAGVAGVVARWRRAEAVDCVRSWCTWRLIGVRQRFFQWVLGSDGVRWQAGMVEV